MNEKHDQRQTVFEDEEEFDQYRTEQFNILREIEKSTLNKKPELNQIDVHKESDK